MENLCRLRIPYPHIKIHSLNVLQIKVEFSPELFFEMAVNFVMQKKNIFILKYCKCCRL